MEGIGHTWAFWPGIGFMEHLISQHIHIPEQLSGWHWQGVEKGLRLFLCLLFVFVCVFFVFFVCVLCVLCVFDLSVSLIRITRLPDCYWIEICFFFYHDALVLVICDGLLVFLGSGLMMRLHQVCFSSVSGILSHTYGQRRLKTFDKHSTWCMLPCYPRAKGQEFLEKHNWKAKSKMWWGESRERRELGVIQAINSLVTIV